MSAPVCLSGTECLQQRSYIKKKITFELGLCRFQKQDRTPIGRCGESLSSDFASPWAGWMNLDFSFYASVAQKMLLGIVLAGQYLYLVWLIWLAELFGKPFNKLKMGQLKEKDPTQALFEKNTLGY